MGLIELTSLLLFVLGLLLAFLATILGIEICCAYTLPSRQWPTGVRPRIAVLVPAHNEELVLQSTIVNIQSQLCPGDRLVVVADNCTDQTGDIAAAEGAEVIYRTDVTRRGKGFALDFGLRHLEADPPEIVIIVDADCLLSSSAVGQLASISAELERPVQANYEMRLPAVAASRSQRIAAFAWRIRNYIRPLGLQKLGLPCQLMGTGMAFSWDLISKTDLKSSEIVEDLALGLTLARANKAPVFAPDTVVYSTFPTSTEGQQSQRERWEVGHLNAIVRYGLPIFKDAFLLRATRQALVLAADNSVPPLSFLVLLIGAYFTAATLFAVTTENVVPMFIAICNASVVIGSVAVLGWWYSGRDILPFRELILAVSYSMGKAPLYLKVLAGKRLAWVRTKRD